MNRVFNKINGILLAGLLVGILIAGLGSGIAFAEYMSFEYDDSALAAEGTHKVEAFTYEMAEGESVYAPAGRLNLDESLPAGTVRVDAEYDSLTMGVEHNIGSMYDMTWIEVRSTDVLDGVERFMQVKDVYLQGLKDGKIVAIPGDYYFDVSVSVNPADKDRVCVSRASAEHAYANKHRPSTEHEEFVG